MQKLIASLGLNLKGLALFSGKESRIEFWPYAAVLILLSSAGLFLVMVPPMFETMDRMAQYAVAHPDQATITQGAGGVSISIQGSHPELMPDFGRLFPPMWTILAIFALLMAAAVTRRLRDRGTWPILALLPVIFCAVGFVAFPKVMGSFEGPQPDLGLFFAVFLNNMAYMASLVWTIVMLGSDKPVKFPPP